LAERAVQSAKNLLERSKRDNIYIFLGLLLIRNTPRDHNLKSPAERLLARKTSIPLPTTDASLKPKIVPNVPSALEKIRTQKKTFYDKNARPLSQLHPGETVRIQEDKIERTGIVTGQGQTPRSYIVQTDTGVYRRNRKHLRPSPIPTSTCPPLEIVPEQSVTPPVPPPRNRLPPPNPPKPMSKQPVLPQTPFQFEETKLKTPVKVHISTPRKTLTISTPRKAPTPKAIQSDTKTDYVTRSGRVVKPSTKFCN
jgi:hypothetical protein